jgi:hypothetical protein
MRGRGRLYEQRKKSNGWAADLLQATVRLHYPLATGGVGAEHASAFSRTSWTALTLEVGKLPTEVPPRRRLPVAPPSAICEFASSSSRSWSSNRAVLDDGRQHGEQDQGARARPALAPAFARARDVYTGIEAGGSNWRKSLLRLIRYSYLPRRRPSAPRAAGRRLRCPRHYGWCYSADTAP